MRLIKGAEAKDYLSNDVPLGVRKLILRLVEQDHALRSDLTQMALLIDKQTTIIAEMSEVLVRIKSDVNLAVERKQIGSATDKLRKEQDYDPH